MVDALGAAGAAPGAVADAATSRSCARVSVNLPTSVRKRSRSASTMSSSSPGSAARSKSANWSGRHVVELQPGRRPGDERVAHPRERPHRHVDVDVALLDTSPPASRGGRAACSRPRARPSAGWRHAHQVEHRRHEVDVAALHGHVVRLDARGRRRRTARGRATPRAPRRGAHAVLAERLAVVARHDDRRALAPRLLRRCSRAGARCGGR